MDTDGHGHISFGLRVERRTNWVLSLLVSIQWREVCFVTGRILWCMYGTHTTLLCKLHRLALYRPGKVFGKHGEARSRA